MPEQQTGAYRNYGFVVQVEGERLGFFLKLSGIGASTNVIEYREGGSPGNVRKLPGRTEINDVVMENGVAKTGPLWQWFKTAMEGRVDRRNVSIVLLGSDGQSEVARWNLDNCWVRRCEVCDLDALGNEVLVDRVVIVAESIEFEGQGNAA